MIQVTKFIVADNTDVLSGTDLDPVPAGVTQAVVYVASSQADTEVTIQAPDQPVARTVNPVLRANGVPDLGADPGIPVFGVAGGKLLINVNIVTGATVGIVVQAG